jgi:hypothetical protein
MSDQENKLLGQCHACGGTVSKKAKVCPHCGQKKPFKHKSGIGTWILIIFAGLVTISILTDAQDQVGNASSSSASAGNYSDTSKQQNWIMVSQDGVRNHLKDPGSAKFKDSFFTIWKETPVVCGHVNSKNSMGGYSGFQRFVASGDSIAYLEEEVADFNNVWREMCQK